MNKLTGTVEALSISTKKHIPKENVEAVQMREDFGIEGDAHAGKWHRQVSFLAVESVQKMADLGATVRPGIFGDNVTLRQVDLTQVAVGDRIEVGECLLEFTQIGKECDKPCAIFKQVGDCIMPREGIFARVIRGGRVQVGDSVRVTPNKKST